MNEDTIRHLSGADAKLILARLDTIDTRLTALETRDAARAYDTNPMWEQTLKEIMDTRIEMRTALAEVRAEMHSELNDVRSGINELRAETQAGFKRVDEHFESLEMNCCLVD